ncbi:hypothetical protein BHY_0481 [Borrelia nietonii YOR]|uniref:Uncharacterized protein n=1 Tax=Borrelia nietonii YOR TaxID=1293576 RepID=A0ABN4C9I5_9SPIR|nr:hypothetical protein BHY_0481 [Borrelia nietonii YOR]
MYLLHGIIVFIVFLRFCFLKVGSILGFKVYNIKYIKYMSIYEEGGIVSGRFR